jgi:hypothetical protein
MLFAISKELETALKARNVPFSVFHEFGDEPFASTYAAKERIVLIEPLDEKRDEYGAAQSTHKNPRVPSRCVDAGKIRIFAKSAKQGAVGHDHIDRARKVRTHVIIALEQVVRARKNSIDWGPMGAVALKDATGSSAWNGAVYEIEFAVDRANEDRKWEGDAADEITIGPLPNVPIKTTTTTVSNV